MVGRVLMCVEPKTSLQVFRQVLEGRGVYST